MLTLALGIGATTAVLTVVPPRHRGGSNHRVEGRLMAVACLIPAVRATRLNPIAFLRSA